MKKLYVYVPPDKMNHHLLGENLAKAQGLYSQRSSAPLQFGPWEQFNNIPCEDGTMLSGYRCSIDTPR